MADLTIRRNENCIVGLPGCGYVFSSTKRVFIAYGFSTSTMEKDILASILRENGLEPIEASGIRGTGKNVFCGKICSEIIMSRFCIVIVNDDTVEGRLSPNANVNMEYGLALGFNKYLVPLQRDDHKLSFNISGLETVKYSSQNFRERAQTAIVQAIKETEPAANPSAVASDAVERYVLSRGLMPNVAGANDDPILTNLARTFRMTLLSTFDGLRGAFLGNFSNVNTQTAAQRIVAISRALQERVTDQNIAERISLGIMRPDQVKIIRMLISRITILIIVNSEAEKQELERSLGQANPLPTEIVPLTEIVK